MSVKLIIDSACDLMRSQAEELGVTLIPMPISFVEQEYLGGVTISPEAFYPLLSAATQLPTTSQPSPYAFEQAFSKVQADGDQAVVLCMSSRLSGTYQSARLIAQDYPDCIWVVDTLSVTIGQQLLLEVAISMRDQGATAEAIANAMEQLKHRVCLCGIIETLDYLVKGGRMSAAAGAVGTLLGIRPVIAVKDGALTVVEKARSKKAFAALTKYIQRFGIDSALPALCGYTGTDPANLNAYLDSCADLWPQGSPPSRIIGSVIGTHTGPHLLAVAFLQLDKVDDSI